MTRPLHELITISFDSEELSQFCFLLGVDDEDLRGSGKGMKALALQQFMGRNGRLRDLLTACKHERPHLDLRPYLYLVVLEAFNGETAVTHLLQHFGLPVRDFPEPEKYAWGSESWREQKVVALQTWLEENGRIAELLDILSKQNIDLSFYH
jgi:hypothetical protein